MKQQDAHGGHRGGCDGEADFGTESDSARRELEEQDMRAAWFARADVERMINNGTMTDAKSTAAYTLLVLHEQTPHVSMVTVAASAATGVRRQRTGHPAECYNNATAAHGCLSVPKPTGDRGPCGQRRRGAIDERWRRASGA